MIYCTLRIPLEEVSPDNPGDEEDDYMPAGDYHSTYGSLSYADDDDDFDDVDPEFAECTDSAPPGIVIPRFVYWPYRAPFLFCFYNILVEGRRALFNFAK